MILWLEGKGPRIKKVRHGDFHRNSFFCCLLPIICDIRALKRRMLSIIYTLLREGGEM
jgi:hypothetical protein